MSIQRTFRTVFLNAVDFDDRTFDLSSHRRTSDVVDSLRKYGVLHPPVIREQNSTRMQIVSGFGRMIALRELGVDYIDAYVLSAKISDRECALLKLAELRTEREPDALEKGRFVVLIDPQPGEADFHELCAAIGVHPTEKALKRAIAALQLPDKFLKMLTEGRLSEDAVETLSSMTEQDCASIARLFDICRPGLNVQRELLEHLQDIAARDNLDISAVLANEAIERALNDASLKPAQKTQLVRSSVNYLRFPHLCEWEDCFAQAVDELLWPPECKLSHHPFFESSRLKIELSFESKEELRSHTEKLQSLCANDDLCKRLRLK
ncbi:ParB N-terminal domain-containing protein [Candidatus Sumerlaeota bacterium]|nr:ParB N-terminal domain-containing protein [Candidatus Sumerlaeota bacterium]